MTALRTELVGRMDSLDERMTARMESLEHRLTATSEQLARAESSCGARARSWRPPRWRSRPAASSDPHPGGTVRRMSRTLPSMAVASFREAFGGEVVLPGDEGYDQARVVWNAAVDRYPAIVVRPTGVDDVGAAVRVGRQQDLVIAVRGGGG